MEVRVAVADASPVQQHRVVQQGSVTLRRRVQFGDEVSELLEMVFVDHVQPLELGRLVLVMRQRMV